MDSGPMYREHHRNLAQHWFFSPGQDFEAWCEMAGFEFEQVRQKAHDILHDGWPQWRVEAGKGKRYQERKAYRARIKQQGLQ